MAQKIKSDWFYQIPFGIWAYFSVFWITFLAEKISFLYNPISYLCIGCIALRECFFLKEYTKKDWIGLAIALFGFINSLLIMEGSVFYACFLIFCGRHTSFRKIMKTCLIAFGLALVTTVVCANTGIIEDYILDPDSTRPRHFLGFLYALYGPSVYFNCAAILVYLRKQKITWIEIVLLLAGNQYLYKMTDSRLSYFSVILLVLFSLLLKYFYDFFTKRTVLKALMASSLVLSMFVGYGVTLWYSPENELSVQVDNKLSHRLQKGKASFDSIGFSLLGRDYDYVGNGLEMDGSSVKAQQPDNYVDCFYIKNMERFGVLFFLLVIGLYTKVLWKLSRRNELYLLMIFSLFALHGILDDLIFTLYYNSFWFLGTLLLNEDVYE